MDVLTNISLDAADIGGETTSNTRSNGGDAVRSQTAAAAARRKKRQPATPRAVPAPVAPDPIATAVSGYSPSKDPAKSAWPVIGSTVRSLVLGAKPGSEEMALKMLRSVARHVALRHQEGMSVTDLSDLLSDQALAATHDSTELKGSSEGTYRGHLERVRAAAMPDQFRRPKELQRGPAPVAAPYSPEDAEALLRWARSTTQVAGAAVRASMLLGLGAGLDGFEVHSVTGRDVRCTPWGLVVAAPGTGKGKSRPARFVPVLAECEQELAEAARSVGGGPMAGDRVARTRSTNGLANAVAKTDGLPRFELGRARATWTRQHLEAGVSFIALKQAGASTSTCAPNQLAVGISMSMAEYVTELRRGDQPFDPSAFSFLTTVANQS